VQKLAGVNSQAARKRQLVGRRFQFETGIERDRANFENLGAVLLIQCFDNKYVET